MKKLLLAAAACVAMSSSAQAAYMLTSVTIHGQKSQSLELNYPGERCITATARIPGLYKAQGYKLKRHSLKQGNGWLRIKWTIKGIPGSIVNVTCYED